MILFLSSDAASWMFAPFHASTTLPNSMSSAFTWASPRRALCPEDLGRRGGSHTGDHMEARFPGGLCPRDGAPMLSATIGGRTTYWCSHHQR